MMFEIRKMDHTGDSLVCECDPDSEKSLKHAEDEYDRLMDKCIAWAGSKAFLIYGPDDNELFDGDFSRDFSKVKQIVIHKPIVGG